MLRKQKHQQELQDLAETFIKGQGTIYVLEACNKMKTSNGIVDNGPEYIEHMWNSRKTNQSDVNNLVKTAAGGHMMYPKFQEHAIIIAASISLVKDIALSKYKSHDFPQIVFNDKEEEEEEDEEDEEDEEAAGKICIINGHHRIAAWKQLHKDLLAQLHGYEKMLKETGACIDSDPLKVEEAHNHVKSLRQHLYAEGGWGAIVLDYGMF